MARTACKEWFNIISYTNFTIYLTTKRDWPQITDRLAQYQKPIGLRLAKNIMCKLEDINEHLLKLTNLTSLKFDEAETRSIDEWLKLTKLSDLQSIECERYYTPPSFELLRNLKRLTHVQTLYFNNGNKIRSDEHLIKGLEQWKCLERLDYHEDTTFTSNIFSGHSGKLTYLAFQVPYVQPALFEEWCENLASLEQLYIYFYDYYNREPSIVSLKSLTSLKALSVNGAQIRDLNTKKQLTFLEYCGAEQKYLEQEIDQLVNLKHLKVELTGRENSNNTWLAAMTALENLYIRSHNSDLTPYIRSNRLTSLSATLGSESELDLQDLTRIASLREICVESDTINFDASIASHLTALELLAVIMPDDTKQKFSISNLTNLTMLHTWNSLALTKLPKLEEMTLHSHHHQWADLSSADLPNLTRLDILKSAQTNDIDISCVSRLTSLKMLNVYVIQKTKYQLFSTLTALESLNFQEAHEADYEHLSTLTNLTKLRTTGPSSLSLLKLPTSLQVLKLTFTHPSSDLEIDLASVTARLPNLYRTEFEYRKKKSFL